MDYAKQFDRIKNTKRKSGLYKTVSVPGDIDEQLIKICNELQASKMKFVTLALERLIDEYNREKSENKKGSF